MKHLISTVVLLAALFTEVAAAEQVEGQGVKTWTLRECLDYATSHNISLQQKQNNYLSGIEDMEEAKAALFPSLSASSSQGVQAGFTGDESARYSGSYGINSDVTLYQGGKLRMALEQKRVQNSMDSLDVAAGINDIRISIIQAYMQCLYAQEAITVSESTLELSKAQRDRAVAMKQAGSLSKVEVAQLESQVYSDSYQLTMAQTNLENYKLQLKQLLELEITDEMELAGTDAGEDDVLRLVPVKSEVYENAMAYLPEVRGSELAVRSAELAEKQARAAYMPSIGLSAGLGTSNMSGTGNAFTKQLADNFNANAGLTLSVPIFSRRQNKTAVNKARLATANSILDQKSTEKAVLKEVENTYLDVISSQAQYVSAKEQEKYAQQSYDLISEQFRLGMKNIVELIQAKNELLSAQQSLLQSKYMALLSLEVLDVYQGK